MRVKNKKMNNRQNNQYLQLFSQFKNLLILIFIIFFNVILCYNETDNNSSSFFAVNHYFLKIDDSFTNNSFMAIRPSLITAINSSKIILRKKRQWGAITLPQVEMSYSRPRKVYGASSAYNNAVSYCPTSCTPCNYNECSAYQVRCVPAVVNCCCPTAAPAYKFDLSGNI